MITGQDIRHAYDTIKPYLRHTPVAQVELAALTGSARGTSRAEVVLKLEQLQCAGSFKARGAFANLLLRELPSAGVVAASGGNHGVAVAYAADRLGVPAKIFVPTVSAPAKVERIRQLGADLVVGGDRYADALAAAQRWAAESGALSVHAFDQRETLLGQGSLGLELADQVTDLDTVLVPVGGGGLIAGIAAFFAGTVRVVGVEPDEAPTLSYARAAGQPTDAPAGGIAADALAPRRIGDLTFPITESYVSDVVLVDDQSIRDAQHKLWQALRVVAEPAAAVGVAALITGAYRPEPGERVAVVISGANTTPSDLDPSAGSAGRPWPQSSGGLPNPRGAPASVRQRSSDPAVVEFDLERARGDTPGCAQVVHFNNAGAALPPAAVTDAVIAHLRLEAQVGGYEAASVAREAVERPYAAISELIGCRPHEVAVVENATRAWDMAFYSLSFQPGDRILTAHAEYASNVIAFLQVAGRTGAVVEVVDDDESGQLDVKDLARRLQDPSGPVKLVAITHVPTQGGLVNPAAEIGRLTREAGVPFLLDACQSVGQLQVNVDEIGCDLLSATGRKFLRAPRGTGFLYVSERLLDSLEPPFLDLHAATWTTPDAYEVRPDARRFENWETNVAAKIGLGVAVDYALSYGLDDIEARVTGLADRLRQRLGEQAGITVHDRGQRRCGIVTFSVDGVSAASVQEHLSRSAINTTVSQASSARFDFPGRGLTEIVRASVHYYNTDDEIAALGTALESFDQS